MSDRTVQRAAVASRLMTLPVGRHALLWIAGYADGADVVLSSSKRQEAHVAAIKAALARQGRPQQMAQGVLTRLSTGTLALSTRGDVAQLASLYAALCRSEGGDAFPDVSIVKMDQARPTDGLTARNLSADQQALAQARAGETGRFCVLVGKGGQPEVVVGTDRDALQRRVEARAAALAAPVKLLRGQLRHTDRGFVLRSKAPAPRLASMLQSWVAANAAAWPDLTDLSTARIQQPA